MPVMLASGTRHTVSSVLACESIPSLCAFISLLFVFSAPGIRANETCFSVIICGLYYVAWIYVIPKLRGYKVRTEILAVDDNGATTHRLVQVPVQEVAAWDRDHDDAGRLRHRG